MAEAPRVSVLIPCYNAERYVAEAVESALAQTHAHVEVVCVDDGSTDGSLERLRAFGDRIVLEAAPHRGGCAARNRALELSHGEFIQYLDADDMLDPEKIERQLPPLLAGEADLVYCNQRILSDDGTLRDRAPAPSPEGMDPFVYSMEYNPPGQSGFINVALPLHRRTCLEAVGGFREEVQLAQDKDLVVRLAALPVRLLYLDEVLFTCRHHDGPRVSTQARTLSWRVSVMLELADIVLGGPPYHVSPAGRDALARRLFGLALEAWHEDPTVGSAGVRRAREISASHLAGAGAGYRALTRLLGGARAERLLHLAVRSKSTRRRFRRLPA